MRRTARLIFTMGLLLSFSCLADKTFIQRNDVQLFIKSMVKQYHFNEKELLKTMGQVQLQPQIIEAMEKPYEKKGWDVYKNLFLTANRLQGGLAFWQENRSILDQASKRYGVPPEIIVAILGVETLYGERQGDNKVLDALSTLAFNYPKRAAYFTSELKEYLLLCREHQISPTTYYGSYAGAMGKPQFMPSSYRKFAVDYKNKGHRDLVTNNADVIASVANYFHQHGWKTNEGIVQHAQIVGAGFKKIQMNPRTANYNYWQLNSAGIKPVTASHNHPNKAGVIALETAQGNEYWMAYPNFFVITRYNASPQYAMVVYLLSQQLKMQWALRSTKKHRAYV